MKALITVLIAMAPLSACGGGVSTVDGVLSAHLYQDDFSSVQSGWPHSSSDSDSVGYSSRSGTDGYQIAGLAAGSSVQVLSPIQTLPHAFHVTADVALSEAGNTASSGDGGVGCVFDGISYVVVVSPGPTFSLTKYTSDGLQTTLYAPPTPPDFVSVSPATNHISLTCSVSAATVSLTALINGHAAATVDDINAGAASAKHVQICLRGESDLEPSTAFFSNLVVDRL